MTKITHLPGQKTLAIEALLSETHEASYAAPDIHALNFCYDLSKNILQSSQARTFPSLQALGFWLRRANLSQIIEQNLIIPPQTKRMPRGIVFQIPPRNVDVLFGYTALLSLLCGNITLVRLWNDRTDEQNCLLRLIKELMDEEHKDISHRLFFLAYDHDDDVTASLSNLCNTRMVWGGDDTVKKIRKIPIPPLTTELSFADRFSAATLKASTFIAADDEKRAELIHNFARDLFSHDQMACTAPRILLWQGEPHVIENAARAFYKALGAFALDKYGTPEVAASVAKTNMQFLALHDLDIETSKQINPALTVLKLRSLNGFNDFKDVNFGHGMLFDYTLDDLSKLNINYSRKDQTLSHWGFDKSEVDKMVTSYGGNGFERYVPVGQALNFDPIWDGHNLFETMTKLVKVTT